MITSKVTLKKPAAKVWQALTDKQQMKEWYFDIPDFELKKGAVFNFYEPGGANLFHHQCTILEIVPEKKFSHTWTHTERSKGVSVVTWLLSDKEGITDVTLEHRGTENFADAGSEFAPENYQMGWNGFMAVLKNYVYGLRKHIYEIEINALAAKVWDILLNPETYKKWTSVFSEGSYYKGELKPGGRLHFLTPAGNGMYGDIIFFTPDSYILFQHIGEIKNLKEQPVDEAAEKWTGSFESYKVEEKDGKTILTAEVDVDPKHAAYFDEAFPNGLKKIKAMAEE